VQPSPPGATSAPIAAAAVGVDANGGTSLPLALLVAIVLAGIVAAVIVVMRRRR
jgi:hypothetical protein